MLVGALCAAGFSEEEALGADAHELARAVA